jgi:hypothetical protein
MSSAAKPDAGAVAVLTGDPALATALADPAIKAKAAGDALMNKNAAGLAAAYLAKIADGPEFIAEVGVLDGAAGLDGNLVFACAGRAKADCIGQIEGAFAGRDPSKISKAVLERVAAKGGIK